jgi:hypothetical protein
MKILFLLLSLLTPFLDSAQTNDQAYTLNAQDRRNYTLSIDQKNISKPKPSEELLNNQKQFFITVPLLLKNNSNDTLKFWSMTCSWEDIYETNNKNAVIPGHGCDSNFPHVISVAPHKTHIVNMPLFLINSSTVHSYKFKLGMHLFNYLKITKMSYFTNKIVNNKPPKNNLIWSNEVEVPIEK